MPARSYDARHRASNNATPRPRRLIAGLALPTAAAVALTFTATGAAVATSTKTQAVIVSQNASATSLATSSSSRARATSASGSATATATMDDPRREAMADNALARTRAAASAARSAERVDLAARRAAAKREEQANDWQLPLSNAVRTSDFGWRWGRLHAGEDFAAPIGTKLVSMSTGTVVFAGEESGYGTLVKIRYWDGTISYFAHMSRISVTEGEGVEPGEIVGRTGNSGHSTGPHLHLEIHPDGADAVDPAIWLADHQIAY